MYYYSCSEIIAMIMMAIGGAMIAAYVLDGLLMVIGGSIRETRHWQTLGPWTFARTLWCIGIAGALWPTHFLLGQLGMLN